MIYRFLLALALVVGGVSAARAVGDTPTEVAIKDFAFGPTKISVPRGATVVWINSDESPHSINAIGKQFRSPALDTGGRYSRQFDEPGSYAYVCGLHPQMRGVIEVTP